MILPQSAHPNIHIFFTNRLFATVLCYSQNLVINKEQDMICSYFDLKRFFERRASFGHFENTLTTHTKKKPVFSQQIQDVDFSALRNLGS
jgi:hypothetical protein